MNPASSLPSIASLIPEDSSSFAAIPMVARAIAAFDAALRAFETATPGRSVAELDLVATGYANDPKGSQFLLNILPDDAACFRGYSPSGKALDGADFVQALRDLPTPSRRGCAGSESTDTRVVIRIDLASLRQASPAH